MMKRGLAVGINRLLSTVGLTLVRAGSESLFQASEVQALVQAHTSPYGGDQPDRADCIIFSMDRALQLEGLLRSYYEYVCRPGAIHILYRTSSAAHQRAYEEVLALYRDRDLSATRQVDRSTFRAQLLEVLASVRANKVFFLVDDDLFVERLDLADFASLDTRFYVPSLRMGENLSRSYTQQREQQLPVLSPFFPTDRVVPSASVPLVADHPEPMLSWSWSEGELDWAYPVSVDGHLYTTQEIRVLAELTAFDSPNTFESNLQRYARLFMHRRGVCFQKSRLVNIPWNRVQSDIANIHGNVDAEKLLQFWNEGMRLDVGSFFGIRNVSAHQEFPLRLSRR
jgi:hypothetical protein